MPCILQLVLNLTELFQVSHLLGTFSTADHSFLFGTSSSWCQTCLVFLLLPWPLPSLLGWGILLHLIFKCWASLEFTSRPFFSLFTALKKLILAASGLSCGMQDLHYVPWVFLSQHTGSLVVTRGLHSYSMGLVSLKHVGSYFPDQWKSSSRPVPWTLGLNQRPLHGKADF